MGKISVPAKAKLFSGIMYRDENVLEKVKEKLVRRFGEIDTESRAFVFDFTDYYEQEMGEELYKKFVVFKRLIRREDIAGIKRFTNSVEDEFTVDGRRIANIDPGYITKANLILTTTKDFPHRIYLGDGIFAEVTLSFKKDACIFFDWTYPDFRQKEVLRFFLDVRNSTVSPNMPL